MNGTLIKQRLTALRALMRTEKIDLWIVLTSDPHLAEYLPAYWQTRVYLSGFTGSAGTLAVTLEDAVLYTDSRYWVQAVQELRDTGISLYKMTSQSPSLWAGCAARLAPGAVIGLDGNTLAYSQYQLLRRQADKHDLQLNLEQDLVSAVWQNRPPLPQKPLYRHLPPFIDRTAAEKITEVQAQMRLKNADYHLISAVDEIAWLTNLRGEDVAYNPVFLAHVLFTAQDICLFVDLDKLTPAISAYLTASGITARPYTALAATLAALAPGRLLIDAGKVTYGTLTALPPEVEIIADFNPVTLLKSRKTPFELDCVRRAMVQDGIALCEFLSWLDAQIAAGRIISELDVDTELTSWRQRQENFVSLSFNTIAGFNANSALPHYAATEQSFAYIKGNGVLLIDSGGQYYNGTTDITRVIAINTPHEDQKKDFTYVLKAHIALAALIYPAGIKMPLLDAVARAPLWQQGLDFGHGTGHGVGYFLNVHEGPQVLSYQAAPAEKTRVFAGMITSNEPGLYREGKWGIRIENLVASVPAVITAREPTGDFLQFSTLTLCPLDLRLIKRELLTAAEKNWLQQYHQKVWQQLSPHLSPSAKNWLKNATAVI